MELRTDSGLTESEWAVILEMAQIMLQIKDNKVNGLSINMSAKEIEDCRNIVRKAKEHT
jgi:hypothetical protein